MVNHYPAFSLDAFCKLALACIKKDPRRRPTISDVRIELERIEEGVLVTSSSSSSEGREVVICPLSGDGGLSKRVMLNPFSQSDFYRRGLEYTESNSSGMATTQELEFNRSAWSGQITELEGR